jgi:hypothetical protein
LNIVEDREQVKSSPSTSPSDSSSIEDNKEPNEPDYDDNENSDTFVTMGCIN